MSKQYTTDLGSYRGQQYFLRVRATPNFDTPDDFAVVIFYKDATAGENVQIVRVDQAHGFTHIDKLYRRDAPKERVDWGIWEAVEQLKSNWRTYADGYAGG